MTNQNIASLPIDKEILQKIKIHCAINKMKMKEYIALLVEQDLKNFNKDVTNEK